MFTIARHQFLDGILDAKYLFVVLLVFIAFFMNGFIYSGRISSDNENRLKAINESNDILDPACASLRTLSTANQAIVKPLSSLAFVADDGAIAMPNSLNVTTFFVTGLQRQTIVNKRIFLTLPIDWGFIIGTGVIIRLIDPLSADNWHGRYW